MAVIRIVAALVFLAATVVAQPAPQISFTLKVTDLAGTLVPAAMIQIVSSPTQAKLEVKTNARGEAVLSLDPGVYAVWVTSPGFETWTSTFGLQRGAGQSMTAVLSLAGNGSPIVVSADIGIEIERRLFISTISLKPLESLTVLPKRARSHYQL